MKRTRKNRRNYHQFQIHQQQKKNNQIKLSSRKAKLELNQKRGLLRSPLICRSSKNPIAQLCFFNLIYALASAMDDLSSAARALLRERERARERERELVAEKHQI